MDDTKQVKLDLNVKVPYMRITGNPFMDFVANNVIQKGADFLSSKTADAIGNQNVVKKDEKGHSYIDIKALGKDYQDKIAAKLGIQSGNPEYDQIHEEDLPPLDALTNPKFDYQAHWAKVREKRKDEYKRPIKGPNSDQNIVSDSNNYIQDDTQVIYTPKKKVKKVQQQSQPILSITYPIEDDNMQIVTYDSNVVRDNSIEDNIQIVRQAEKIYAMNNQDEDSSANLDMRNVLMHNTYELIPSKATFLSVGDIQDSDSGMMALQFFTAAYKMQIDHNIKYFKYVINPDYTITTDGRYKTTLGIKDIVYKIFQHYDIDNAIEFALVQKVMGSFFDQASQYCQVTGNYHGAAQFFIFKSIVMPQTPQEVQMQDVFKRYTGRRQLYDARLTITETAFKRTDNVDAFIDHPNQIQDMIERMVRHQTPFKQGKLGQFYVQQRTERFVDAQKKLIQMRELAQDRAFQMKRKEAPRQIQTEARQKISFMLPSRNKDEIDGNQMFDVKRMRLK